MKKNWRYVLTVKKDLPLTKAGFKLHVTDSDIDRYERNGRLYDDVVSSVLWAYEQDTGFIEREPDKERSVQVQCPKCGAIGMMLNDTVVYISLTCTDCGYETQLSAPTSFY